MHSIKFEPIYFLCVQTKWMFKTGSIYNTIDTWWKQKNKFKRKFKQWKQIEKEVQKDNKPNCNFENSKQLGGAKEGGNLKQ